MLCQILIIILYLPWLNFMLSVIGGGGQSWRSHLLLRIFQTFFSFSLGYSAIILDTAAKQNYIHTLKIYSPILILFCLSFGILFCLGMWKSFQNRYSAIILFTVLFGIVAAAALISLKVMIFDDSYLILCSPAFYIFIAIGIYNIKYKFLRWGAVGLISLLLLFSLFNYFFNPRFGKDQYRDAARFVATFEHSHDIILFHKPYIDCAFNYYYKGPLPKYQLPNQAISETSQEFTAVKKIIQNHPRFWLILSQNFDTDSAYPDLLAKFYPVVLKREFTTNNGITVYLYQVNPMSNTSTSNSYNSSKGFVNNSTLIVVNKRAKTL